MITNHPLSESRGTRLDFGEDRANQLVGQALMVAERKGIQPNVKFWITLDAGIRWAAESTDISSRKVFICTGLSSAKKLGFIDRVISALPAVDVEFIDGIPQDPPIASAAAFARKLSEAPNSAVIAVGGGSVIDFAKVATAFAGIDCDVELALRTGGNSIPRRNIPLIAVPTTAGTGSEGTPYAVLTNAAGRRVFAKSAALIPNCGVVATDLLSTLPQHVIREVGFDAFTHALEALWSKSASRFSDLMAREALALFGANLPAFASNPADRKLAASISIASSFAGLAFGDAYTVLCHALSFPISERTGVSHGKACALTIAEVADFYSSYHSDSLDWVASKWGLSSSRKIPGFIKSLKVQLRETDRLGTFGLSLADDYSLVDGANTSMIENSVIPVSNSEARRIIRAAV